ncbi:NADH:flavin oxidoreductase [Halomarina pelagica]|uniref:NADH:flavin oxidoreductase n=1 Tax=Halomarina pelagica TaxID=2961599 RepID=UPI0020C3D854|nr:NADH:flavin oxidoreductase [Halomarina sp. BND7]
MTENVLFESVSIGGLDLDNRVGLAPMTRTSATADGRATTEMARYYAKFARGGFGVLITEGTYVDAEHSQGYDDQPGLVTDDHVEAWRRVTDAVHDEGSPILAQLMHAGPQMQGNRYVEEAVGPSEVEAKGEQLELYGGSGEFPAPRRLSADDLDDVAASFADAARNAHEAGFDGVEVHGANGYLLDAFLTDYLNRRDDEYGGDAESRVRFPATVVESVREATPEDFVVGIRLSQTKVTDDEYRWPGGADEAEVVFGTLSEAGVDYLHVTEPDATEPAFDAGSTLTELAATYGDTPVVANGSLGAPEKAREAVEDGASVVTLATGALANSDWPKRVADGRPLDEFDPAAFLVPDASLTDAEVPSDVTIPADD